MAALRLTDASTCSPATIHRTAGRTTASYESLAIPRLIAEQHAVGREQTSTLGRYGAIHRPASAAAFRRCRVQCARRRRGSATSVIAIPIGKSAVRNVVTNRKIGLCWQESCRATFALAEGGRVYRRYASGLKSAVGDRSSEIECLTSDLRLLTSDNSYEQKRPALRTTTNIAAQAPRCWVPRGALACHHPDAVARRQHCGDIRRVLRVLPATQWPLTAKLDRGRQGPAAAPCGAANPRNLPSSRTATIRTSRSLSLVTRCERA